MRSESNADGIAFEADPRSRRRAPWWSENPTEILKAAERVFVQHGNSIDLATCEIYKTADGLVDEPWVYQDPAQMFAQMAAGQSASLSS